MVDQSSVIHVKAGGFARGVDQSTGPSLYGDCMQVGLRTNARNMRLLIRQHL
jgi:hypothetical protein